MVQVASEHTEAPIDHPVAKGDPEIIRQLRRVLSYGRRLPAFSRGQMIWDFDLGKVRIAK